jgi:hypothetical protein
MERDDRHAFFTSHVVMCGETRARREETGLGFCAASARVERPPRKELGRPTRAGGGGAHRGEQLVVAMGSEQQPRKRKPENKPTKQL